MTHSTISLTSLKNANYATLVNVATGQEREVTDAQVSALIGSGKWKHKPAPVATNGDAPTAKPATQLRKGLTRADRKKISDANRAESLVIPSAIADAVKDGLLVEPLAATFVDFIEKRSRNTGNTYSAAQISITYEGETYKFCILDNPDNVEFEVDNVVMLQFAETSDPAIRSGVNYEVVA